MTADEWVRAFAARSGVDPEWLLATKKERGYIPEPCECGWVDSDGFACEGWGWGEDPGSEWLADWEREYALADMKRQPTVAEIRALPNAPTHVVWFNAEPRWKRLLRRLHLIRKPKPFDWKAATKP